MTFWTKMMWKTGVLYSVVFSTLFVAHIIAAANEWDFVFRIIVTLVTIQTMLVGLICHFVGSQFGEKSLLLGRWACIPLSLGLGWAYTGMEYSWVILLWAIVAIFLQVLTEKGLKYITRVEQVDG